MIRGFSDLSSPIAKRMGEGDREAVEGASLTRQPLRFAPSTMLRMVPLPRCAGENFLP